MPWEFFNDKKSWSNFLSGLTLVSEKKETGKHIELKRTNSMTNKEYTIGTIDILSDDHANIRLETDDKNIITVSLNGRNAVIVKKSFDGKTEQKTTITTTVENNIASSSNMPDANTVVEQNTKTEIQIEESHTQEAITATDENKADVAIFCDETGNGVIYEKRNNILYGEPKIGKTKLLTEILKSEKIKSALLFLIDDINEDDIKRLQKIHGNKIRIISSRGFEAIREELKNGRRFEAFVETLYENENTDYKVFKRLATPNLAQRGISTKQSFDDVDVLNDILSMDNHKDIDFICIDSLTCLAGDSRRINRNLLNKILSIPSKNGVTLLMLHHTNKKGEIAGSLDSTRMFDNI
jgi:predicted ATP-dependent serine protease